MRGLEKIGLGALMAVAATVAAGVTSYAKDYTNDAAAESTKLRDLERKIDDYERREAEAKQREEERRAKYISELAGKAAKYDMAEKAREEARIEAQRQAALERERRKEAKRKALEKAAVEKAQEVERKLQERKKLQEKANASKIQDMALMHPILLKKRVHLKE